MTDKIDEIRNTLTFDVDAQLITELGERLVSRNHLGIAELIKNAYDADSPNVDIIFKNVTQDQNISELVISDKGTGMTFETVKNNWMKIGTNNKRSKPFSKIYGRPVTGNKGIGRFACQRLAGKLELSTCAKIDELFEHTKVQFYWDDFIAGSPLSKIKCNYVTYKSVVGITGTELKLIGLREKISERDFKMILKSITLISVTATTRRSGFKEDPGFKTNIIASEFQNIIGGSQFYVDEHLLRSGWGTLSGFIDEKGTLELTLESKGSETQTYSYENDQFCNLSGISFVIHIMPLKSRDNIEYRRNPTLLTRQLLKDITDIHSGIKLYLNNFRVYPYGDVNDGDDWLRIAHDISRRRGSSDYLELQDLAVHMGIQSPNRAMLNHPGIRSLIGNVLIDGKSVDSFVVKMDREGLVENENLTFLRKAIRMSLDWATIHYEAWLIKARKLRHTQLIEEFEESVGNKFTNTENRIVNAINTLRTEDINQQANIKRVDSLNEDISDDVEFLHEENENIEDQKNIAQAYLISEYKALEAESELLRALSGTAPLLFIFAHEVKGISQTLLGHSSRLKHITKGILDNNVKEELLDIAHAADLYKQSFDSLFDLFDVFSDSTGTSSRLISYNSLFQSIQTGLGFFLTQYKIQLNFKKVNRILKLPKLNYAEAYSVMINLISNSIKCLIASDSDIRNIEVGVEEKNSSHIIQVKDNGIGLKQEFWDKVFEPKVFDPENRLYKSVYSILGDEKISNIGKGNGLGLNIVKNIFKKHNATIMFVQPTEQWKAVIEINIGT